MRILSSLLLSALALAASVTAGCAASAVPSEPTLVRVIMADDWASAPAVREVIDEFEREHDRVRVQVQAVPFSQIPDLVASAQRLEQPYDLAHWHAFAAAAAGLATPLDERWEEAGLRAGDFLPGAVEDVTWLGARYGVPLDTNALVLLADEHMLEAARLKPEDLATPQGFRAAAEAVTASGAASWMMPVSTSSWQAYGWIRALGGEVVEVDSRTGRPTFTFDDPATVTALEYLVELATSEFTPPPYGPDFAADAVQAFVNGDTAVHATGSWDLRVVARNATRDLDLRVLPLPQQDPERPVTVLGGSSLFLPQGAGQPELAFALALRLTDDEVAVRLATEEGRLPARVRVFRDPVFTDDPLLSDFVPRLSDARVMPLIAYPDIAQAFSEALNAVITGRQEAAEAMAGLQDHAEAWLATRPAG
ncbi:extracellular solute-binding protein [Egicoccus halophilus]|uniref:ABC transporter substrate-binding protein n=1 Tax=Egicoccus halophilus TaxID=1670830 RepID=A0A8J3ADK4_9ACTN|nr:extracellular solute-binding protein [Egicoccus halophilus]GGI09715.1 hypothetical protein GCM10011354_35450 [Egicoccus halophilus]